MRKVYPLLCTICLLVFAGVLSAQTLNDGPIQLQVRFADWKINYNETDASALGVGFAPDEPVIHLWGRDNANLDGQGWLGGACHTYSSSLPTTITGINEMLINYTYPTAAVPQYYDLRIDAYEDDAGNNDDQVLGLSCTGGSFCAYNGTSCCGFILFGQCIGLNEGDDRRCNVDPWITQQPYRNGPPCTWYNQGFLGAGTCSNDYEVRMETFWRYTNGTSCANALDLGTINTGGTLTHFNSNECYSNTHTASAGNDVWYKFHANGPIGITASLCGVNGAQFDSYLYLYSACGAPAADTANDDGCGTQSTLAYSICQAGDYYLVVDGKAAGDMGTFTLSVSDNPNFVFGVSIAKQDVSCFGAADGQVTANVTGGLPPYTYAWSPSGSTATLSGLGGGTYTVSVTDAKGCVATASVQLNVPPQLTATATGNPVTCGGACDGSATVTAQGGTPPYTYGWNSLPPQQLQNATFLCAGNYIVTVTDDNSCTVAANTTVPNTTTVIITVDTIKNVQCFGFNNGSIEISATGGQTPYTYAWSNNGVSTQDNPNLGPGTYTLTLTDNIGCTAGDSYTITEPAQLTSVVSFTFNPRCNGGNDGIVNINVNGGVQPYTYLWSAPSNATSQNLNNVVAGTHTVTVSDANVCTVTSTTALTEPTPFSINLTSTNLLCNGGTDGTATVNVSGATPGYTYFWSNFNTTPNTTGLNGGPFSVVIEDANGCDTIVTGTITEPAGMDVLLTANEPLCADSGNGSITTLVTGGTSPFTYSWTGTGGFTSSAQNPTVGSGSYTVTVTDVNGCFETGSVGVNAGEPFSVSVIAINPNCIGDSTGAVTASTTGGSSPLTYNWSTGATGSAAYVEKISKGSYAVTVTDANGCQASGQAVLADPATDPESCKGDKFVVLVPTAFTPNGDNINDRLVAIMRNVQKLELSVYNRWGQLVYNNTNMLPGDGWDGVYNGIEQPMGTYVYSFTVTYINGVRTTDNGSATLIR
jgi:gliding motility-associated-like protein